MRKSTYVTILLGGAAVLGVWALSNGTQNMSAPEAEEKVYGDVDACAKDADATACAQEFDAAKKQHEIEAPKFTNPAECEAAFTKCEATEVRSADGSSHSMFMPMMMGFMMGRMMGGMGGYGYGGGFGGGGFGGAPNVPQADRRDDDKSSGGGGGAAGFGRTARPVYADRNGYLYTNGSSVGRVAPGTTSLGSQGVPMRTASRGGFGATAGHFSGGS